MKIHVTEDDIRNGTRCNKLGCPVAKALKKAFPQFKWNVDEKFLHRRKKIKTPKSVAKFIACFDEAKEVEPFSFILKLP